jgi:chemotaxis-related protein WspB
MLFVQFTLGADRYLIDGRQIERMLPVTPLKALPGAPAWVAGILTYEDEPVPVIDMTALALGRPSHERLSTRLALVCYPRANGERRLGVLLEQATRTVTLDVAAFGDAGIDTPHARYLGPVASDAEGLMQWVRVEHLLPPEVQALLFAGSAA